MYRFNTLLLVLLTTATVQAQDIDLLIKNSHLIDPKNEIYGTQDVAIKDGKIFEVSDNISESRAKTVVDVSGLFVTPGLIDLHVHKRVHCLMLHIAMDGTACLRMASPSGPE